MLPAAAKTLGRWSAALRNGALWRRGGTCFDGEARFELGVTFAPGGQAVEHWLIRIEFSFFENHSTVFDSSALPSVVCQRLALDATKLRRLVNPALDFCLRRRVKHDGRLAPSHEVSNLPA